MQTSSSIDDQHIAAGDDRLPARLSYEALDRSSVGLARFAFVNLSLHRLRHNFQLLTRGRTVNVNRNQQRTVPASLEPVRQLAGRCGLAGTLQSGHEHDGRWLRCELNARRVFAESLD